MMLFRTYLNGAEAKPATAATYRSHRILHSVSCGIPPGKTLQTMGQMLQGCKIVTQAEKRNLPVMKIYIYSNAVSNL